MIDTFIIVFIHYWLVSKFYQMKEKGICYIMIYGCYGLFCSLKFYDFLKFKFAEKSDGGGLRKK